MTGPSTTDRTSVRSIASTGAAPPRVTLPVDRTRWALLLCWLVLLVSCLGFAERPASLHDLTSAIESGQVHSVRVGPPLEGGGWGIQEVHWRRGVLRHQTDVMMWTQDRSAADGAADGASVRHGRDIAAHLRTLDPQLQVTRAEPRSSYGQVYDWYVPAWLGVATFVLILATLGLLISGPRPWRATRWAWFWLMATPVGVLAFLALAGPTPRLPAPKPGRPLLRGGFALLLAALMSAVLPSWWHTL